MARGRARVASTTFSFSYPLPFRCQLGRRQRGTPAIERRAWTCRLLPNEQIREEPGLEFMHDVRSLEQGVGASSLETSHLDVLP